MANEQNLLLCPFCGGEAWVVVCDEEGNVHEECGYEEDPWSGILFALMHNYDENLIDLCPIASHGGEILGMFLYDTREEAENAWNGRISDGTAK